MIMERFRQPDKGQWWSEGSRLCSARQYGPDGRCLTGVQCPFESELGHGVLLREPASQDVVLVYDCHGTIHSVRTYTGCQWHKPSLWPCPYLTLGVTLRRLPRPVRA